MTDYKDIYRLRGQWERYLGQRFDNNPEYRHCRQCWALPAEPCTGPGPTIAGEIPSYRGVSLGVHLARHRGWDSAKSQHGPAWPPRIPRGRYA